jgi:hypothetical protein
MTVDQILTAIANVGFPVFVAVYLLVFVTKAIKANTSAVNSLKEIVAKLCDKLKLE